MWEFNERLRALPLGIVRAMHVEGTLESGHPLHGHMRSLRFRSSSRPTTRKRGARLTKVDLIEALFQRTRFDRQRRDRIVALVLDAMKETLADGESVMISGFGKFSVRKKTARAGRNPPTGAAVGPAGAARSAGECPPASP